MADLPAAVQWVPKYTGIVSEDRCKLYCRAEYSSAYYMLATSVADGTPCGVDTFHKCIAGQCVPAGCDHRLGSDAGLDQCGVCQGDNSSCRRETGRFDRSDYGYNFVVRIPAGASGIDIRQQGHKGRKKVSFHVPSPSSYFLSSQILLLIGFLLISISLFLFYLRMTTTSLCGTLTPEST
jgi:hypothetical protein